MCPKKRGKIISCFVKLGVNINAVNKEGKTALHLAVGKKLSACVKELLRQGAKYDIPDIINNKTAVDYAQQINDSEILDLFPKFSRL